jgi:hypothetical protein
MDYRISGREVAIQVKFVVDGDFVTPDTSSVRYTLYDETNAEDGVYTNINPAVTSPATSLLIKLVANSNTLGVGAAMERRNLVVTFTYQTASYTLEFPYLLVPAIALAIGPKQVRTLLAVSDLELPDTEINLRQAYWDVANDISETTGQDDLDEMLEGSTADTAVANRAIALKCALGLIPTMPMRVMVSEEGEGKSFTRARVDWKAMGDMLAADYGRVMVALGVTDIVTQDLLILSDETDPVTGA